MRMILAALALTLSACGKPVFQDPSTLETLEAFRKAARERNILVDTSSISIKLQKGMTEKTDVLGECSGINDQQITLDEEGWLRRNWLQKEVLLFHELGHCALGRSHTSGKEMTLGIPKSIMNPGLPSDRAYSQNRTYYLDELFGKVPQP